MTQPLDEPLSADRIDALYRAHVSPMVFRRTRAVERPTAVFVGAQPGAGKSSILTRLRGRFLGNVALISGDDFRQFIRRTRVFATPIRWPCRTSPKPSAGRR